MYNYNKMLLNRIKDEKQFAITVTGNYKMSNTKNKDFVNAIILDINDLKKNFNFEKFENEINKLNFHLVPISNNPNYLGLIKNDESRKIIFKRIILVENYK